jgi:hypothetical protein
MDEKLAAHCETTCVRIWQRGRILAEQGQAEDLPSAVGARVACGRLRHHGQGVRIDGHRLIPSSLHPAGYDWIGRYPPIARAASPRRVRSFAIDGAAVCGPNGVPIVDALYRRVTITEVCSMPSHRAGTWYPTVTAAMFSDPRFDNECWRFAASVSIHGTELGVRSAHHDAWSRVYIRWKRLGRRCLLHRGTASLTRAIGCVTAVDQ